ncbi:AraC family transcriptional regulator [Burkholderia vietnamiensis]|uniref:AraC family transcriptional regulator n=1 Tax=Burkholderia vietnamiensis TaxID=60552 RepID=A0ABS1B2D7_BURVI|nr:AraC family transcriptional regulator [Burkholderia vietnamiensis]MBJ9690529.1 AraC family transcriptional regulator [Burkholderia vietnamiensis]MCO1350774.1 AraC family transcriptional regulator [Burkholderia vietnamiensis]MCO1434023.1 AraC family transcriptional regulator [Burkholderia vietnamiensis]MEC4598869.1 AraC family transcriptional regulator [Burkholderia vietnamiensis]UQN48650.1 AraC family transcriptional regulator [Burkholderia vietnamiensis]
MAPQMISPGFVEDALECLHRQRIPAEPVLRAAGLPVAVREPVTPQQYGRLWLAIASAIDDEFFGLAARPMRRGSFTLLCHAVLDAGTLEKALRRALQFLRVVLDEPRGELVVADGQAQIALTQAGTPYSAFVYRTFWLILLGVACWLIGRRIPLQRIDFACPSPDQRSDYHQFFGVPVHFDRPDSRLAFNAAYLSLPTIRSAQSLKTFLRGAPGNLLVRYRHDSGWVAKTRAHLKALPAAEWPDFDTLAVRLGTTPATLRRRLRSEGQSFAAIKDELRSALAQALLRGHKLSVAEIAAELGFTEPSAFHRAFRKWTGTSPGAFRRDVNAVQLERGGG